MRQKKERDLISLLDLFTPYESGPVLRERTPDLNRFTFGPGELTYNESDDFIYSDDIRKEAIGLTSVPAGGPYGSSVSRESGKYDDADFQTSHTTGFGGPSILDIEEDKPPQNIRRLDKRLKKKPINISTKKEKPEFFNFLETGKIHKESLGEKMSNRKTELNKLAKALELSGYNDKAVEIRKLAQSWGDVGTAALSGAVAGSYAGGPWGAAIGGTAGALVSLYFMYKSSFSGGKKAVLDYMETLPASLHKRAASNPTAVFVGAVSGGETNDDEVIAACFYSKILSMPIDTKQIPVSMLNRSTLGVGTDYKDMTPKQIVESEMSGTNRGLALAALTFTPADKPQPQQAPTDGIPEMLRRPDDGVPEMLRRPDDTTSGSGGSGASSRTSTTSRSTGGASSGSSGILFRDIKSDGPVHQAQRILGVKQDGLFGPDTLKAWKAKTGRTDNPMSPEAALDALTGAGGTASPTASAAGTLNEVLSAFLVVKEGEVPGLDLSKRSVSMDTIAEADEYLIMLGSKKSILEQQFAAAAGANRDAVELVLMKIYSQKKGTGAAATGKTEVRDIGQFYASPMGLFVSKSDGEIYYTNPQDPNGPKLPLSTRTPDFLTDEEARSLFAGIADPKLRRGMRKYLRAQRQVERSIGQRPGAMKRMEQGRATILDQSSTPAPPPAPATGDKVTAASEIRKNRLEKMARKMK